MIKKTIVSICIVCLALGGYAENNLLPGSGASLSAKPVTVKLTLDIDDYNALSAGRTRMEEIPPMLSMFSPDMDAELVATPSITRVTPSVVITEDDTVYSYMGFQFDGAEPNGKLVEKGFFTSPDGSTRTDKVETMSTPAGQGSMVVVLTNINKSEFATMMVGSSTYGDLQQFCVTLATGDGTFPRSKVTLPSGGGEKTGIVMCDQTAAEISAGKQLCVSLKRTAAKVTFNIKTAYQHSIDVEHAWNVTLMNIPTQSYYNIIGKKAIFPSESSIDRTGLFWTKSLKTVTTTNPVINTGPIYIPINLQQTVSTSAQSTRRGNAPTGGTYLQIMGLENTTVPGSSNLSTVRDFSIYQLFLGKNFTTDFSVSVSYGLTCNITLRGSDLDDTNVIRLIPGHFSGELAAYGVSGIALSSVNNVNAIKWKCPNKIELHFSDGYYPVGGSSGTTTPRAKDLKWYAGAVFDKRRVTSMADGHKDAGLLQATGIPWGKCMTAYTCYRGTDGYDQGVATEDILWYLPSASELMETWVPSSGAQKQLAGGYWSSTANSNADKAFVVTSEGKVCSDAVDNTHAVRASQDPDKVAHVGGVDK